MHPKWSYWEKESFFKGIDIAVIGSGIVGLSAAIRLKELNPGLKVAIFEKGALPMGASTRNAGFACFGSLTELLEDMKSQNESVVFDLIEKRWRGLCRLRERIGDNNLQYQELGGYEVFKKEEEALFRACKEQMAFFNDRLFRITGRKQVYRIADEKIPDFGFRGIGHLIMNHAEGQLHTGQMMYRLLQIAREKNISLFNGFSIRNFQDTQQGCLLFGENDLEIQCSKVIIATNGFTRRLIPRLDIQPARNQVLITKPIPHLAIKGCFHYDKGYYYFRNIDQRILLGGGRNLAPEAEFTDEFGATKVIKNALLKLLQHTILPGRPVEIDSWWSGILGVGKKKEAIVKKHSEHIFIAARLGGMGVAIGSLVGEEVADLAYSS